MKAIKSRTCSTEKNFQDFLNNGIKANKVAEATTIAANSWAWNNTYKACHINGTSAGVKETIEMPLGYFKVGDIINLSAEFMNISGVKGKIALDYAGDVSGNAFIVQTALTNEFENLGVTHAVKYEGYYTALFGIFTADIGEFYVRNCVARCESSYLEDSSPYKQTAKAFTIKTTGIGVFAKDVAFGMDDCTITVNASYLVLNFSKPFTYYFTKPIVTIGKDVTSRNYNITTSSATNNTITIQLWDSAGNLVDHTQIVAGIYFSIIAVGYDLI